MVYGGGKKNECKFCTKDFLSTEEKVNLSSVGTDGQSFYHKSCSCESVVKILDWRRVVEVRIVRPGCLVLLSESDGGAGGPEGVTPTGPVGALTGSV